MRTSNPSTKQSSQARPGAASRLLALASCGLLALGLAQAREASAYDPRPLMVAAAPGTGGRDITTTSDEGDLRKRARIRMELATAYYAQGQMTTALDEVKQALVTDPSLPGANNLRGLIYDALGNDALAEDSFSMALKQDAQDGSTLHNYAWFLCRRRQFDRADEMFGRALAMPQYRSAAQTLLVRGVCLSRSGHWEDAEKTLIRAYELDAGNPATATNLAYALYRRGEYERARFYIRRVNGSQDLSNAQTLWLAARIEHRLGNLSGRDDLGDQLRNRYPSSREATAYERKQFED